LHNRGSRQLDLKLLSAVLADSGLALRGVAEIPSSEQREYSLAATYVALVGNVGPAMWPVFSSSPEFNDGREHPLDRWSQRIAAEVSARFDLDAVFPFTGPPYLPFQRWARAADPFEQSPLGLLMHPQYGLWHAYRFALLLPEWSAGASPAKPVSICQTCIEKPCLNTCPVAAISVAGYDVPACVRFLSGNDDTDCHQRGCMARFSCPEARESRYDDAQSRFHLQAFINANQSV
jgi:hypothetical protein